MISNSCEAMGIFTKHPARLIIPLITSLILAFGLITDVQAQQGQDSEIIQQGAQIFAENCAVCHGEDGQGRVGATLAKDWPSIRPDLQIRDTIERGIQDTFMPAWGKAYGGPLEDRELDALTTYILSWESGEPRLIYPTPTVDNRIVLTPLPGVEGDPNRGAQLYALNCEVCHGENGEGRVGANLARPWSSVRPDLRIKAVIESGVEDSFMPPWSQEQGGPLSDQDINDITAYILTWSGTETEPEAQTPSIGPLTGWPVWVIFISAFVLIIIAIVYYSRQRSSED
jgi:mono/diheme cytochrome c family protein